LRIHEFKKCLKKCKANKKPLRNFAAFGGGCFEKSLKYSDRFSRSCSAFIKTYMEEMEDYEKEVFLAFFGGSVVFGDLFTAAIMYCLYLRQSN